MGVDLIVDATATYTGLACPGINVRACLASLHVSHATLVPKITDFRIVASLGSVLRTYSCDMKKFLSYKIARKMKFSLKYRLHYYYYYY